MKECKLIAIAAIAVIALASCQKMENVGYDSSTGRVEEKTSTKQLLMNAAPTIQLDTVFLSIVPAHKDDDGIFRDGKGLQKATKCLFVKYNNGCKIVVFDAVLPSIEEVANAPLLEGDMTGYNSAYFNGEAWLPAFAEDVYTEGEFVALRYSSSAPIPRTVRKETLLEWQKEGSWEKEFTTRLDGYTVTVNDGSSLVVSCGEATLILE